jgi:ubiquinone/menaquinone biosynthesis C-methylase UbiE
MSLSQRLFAAGYDLLNAGVEGRLTSYRQQTAGEASGDVLEIGGGTGANLPFYRGDVRLTVVEPNPHMTRRLRRRAARLGRRVTVVAGSGEKIPFPDASFDSVVTTLVLCMVDDLEQVVREARRVLRPGGAFYFYEHVASKSRRRRRWEDRLNPAWRFLTTGCNLNRDTAAAIRAGGFSRVALTAFDLSVGLPITLPNIIGEATA